MANTGYAIVLTLKRVRLDIVDTEHPFYREPMDENGIPCRLSGLPQETKVNDIGDPDYIAPYENLDACPLPLPTFPFKWIPTGGYCETELDTM